MAANLARLLAAAAFAALACGPAMAKTALERCCTIQSGEPLPAGSSIVPPLTGREPLIWVPALEIHFAPEENLEAIDVELINNAGKTIDLAAYVLNDENVIDALQDAAMRGVAVRVLRDPSEILFTDSPAMDTLKATPGISVRVAKPGPLMHLKSFAIDGEVYRTGSANFSFRGEHTQDNDLAVIRSAEAAAQFEAHFEKSWGRAK